MEQESSNYYSDGALAASRASLAVWRAPRNDDRREPTDRLKTIRALFIIFLCASIIFCQRLPARQSSLFIRRASRPERLLIRLFLRQHAPPTGLNRFFPTLHVGHLYDLGNAAIPLEDVSTVHAHVRPARRRRLPTATAKLRNAVAIGRSRLDAGLDTRLDDDDDDIIVLSTLERSPNARTRTHASSSSSSSSSSS